MDTLLHYHYNDGKPHPECKKCQQDRLIAAAPELLAACETVINYNREHDSGEGELFGLDFVTTCIEAVHKANPDWRLSK